ncbi:hypothetical protein [Nocardioides sp.]|uniref:hypothetical protein n=1 Tax=Nocardioides sp. TaxID=35761 RepID=UPI002719ACBD|nr:hypothetical protein [Nocardioides sp.]MDO9458403.1 hypothetical protein [Nocardioides sp.]
MTSTPCVLGPLVVLVLAVGGLTTTAAPAEAAPGRHFRTVVSVNGAKLAACRVPTSSGSRVFGRVNARRATTRTTGYLASASATRTWSRVRRGSVSATKSLAVARGGTVLFTLNGPGSSSSAEVDVAELRRC